MGLHLVLPAIVGEEDDEALNAMSMAKEVTRTGLVFVLLAVRVTFQD